MAVGSETRSVDDLTFSSRPSLVAPLSLSANGVGSNLLEHSKLALDEEHAAAAAGGELLSSPTLASRDVLLLHVMCPTNQPLGGEQRAVTTDFVPSSDGVLLREGMLIWWDMASGRLYTAVLQLRVPGYAETQDTRIRDIMQNGRCSNNFFSPLSYCSSSSYACHYRHTRT